MNFSTHSLVPFPSISFFVSPPPPPPSPPSPPPPQAGTLSRFPLTLTQKALGGRRGSSHSSEPPPLPSHLCQLDRRGFRLEANLIIVQFCTRRRIFESSIERSFPVQGINSWLQGRGERERLLGSREREGKLKITFPFYGKGTGIRKCYGKEGNGREI